jgi:hypothetical protein
MHLGAATATVRHTWQRHGRPEPLLLMRWVADLFKTCEEPPDKKSGATRAERHADTPEMNLGAARQQSGIPGSVMADLSHCCSWASQQSFLSPAKSQQTSNQQQQAVRDVQPDQKCTWERHGSSQAHLVASRQTRATAPHGLRNRALHQLPGATRQEISSNTC